ncbi:hypothetical protein [Nocardia wallacei]|uniref:hypothetical protein n=1 Tax=Nocardia wallacei TaxID=480035 RepID=UPI002458FB02|nr:hypothetical protein [Nocardia wallacei]
MIWGPLGLSVWSLAVYRRDGDWVVARRAGLREAAAVEEVEGLRRRIAEFAEGIAGV